MASILGSTRSLLIFAVLGMLGAAILVSRAQDKDLQALSKIEEDAVHWQAAQLEIEFSHFLSDLTRFTLGDLAVEQQHVSERLDVLWSRAAVTRNGEVGALLREYDKDIGAIPVLLSKLRTHEAQLLDLDRSRTEANQALIAAFSDLRPDIRRLSLHAVELEQARLAGVRADILSGAGRNGMVFHVSLLIAVFLTGLFFVSARRHERTERIVGGLEAEGRAAELAKSRFLSMMSHELRTPMNGVLGLIQLLKQSRLTESQQRLIEQVERSGAQMTELLGDILELSELQSERLEIDSTAYQPVALATSISGILGAAAMRNRTQVAVSCAPGTPEWVLGDFARLRQALAHIGGSLVGDDRVRAFRLDLSHDRGELVCAFGIDTFTTGGSRRGGGAPAPGTDPDALGLTIARGLIELMGGTIAAGACDGGAQSVVVRLPATIVYPRRDCVRIEERSETSALLLRSAVEEAGWHVWSPRLDAARVGVVLLELPVENESATVDQLKSAHPGARLVAVGKPVDRSIFDVACFGVTDHQALHEALGSRTEASRAG